MSIKDESTEYLECLSAALVELAEAFPKDADGLLHLLEKEVKPELERRRAAE